MRRAHDVRTLRYCTTCQGLDHKSRFISGKDDLCVACAFRITGSVEAFMAVYPPAEWAKLPLNLVGVDGMRRLIAALEASRADKGNG